MNQFLVRYYFSKEFSVTQIVESESKGAVLDKIKTKESVEFEDLRGNLHFFNIKDVVLVTVNHHQKPRAAKSF